MEVLKHVSGHGSIWTVVLAAALLVGCNENVVSERGSASETALAEASASKSDNNRHRDHHHEVTVCKHAESAWIFCDDFESKEPLEGRYYEYVDDEGDFAPVNGRGRAGGTALRAIFQQGEVSAGNIKKAIGRAPDAYRGQYASSPNETFTEIYWRMDVKRQEGWIGGGGHKLARATTFATPESWAQGMIAHLWSGGSAPGHDYLVMDPASGISADGELKATGYNDFANLRWLGAKQGTTPLFNEENAGDWFSVEAHVKLNTPGQFDGVFEFWVNGELQAGSYDLNWHGDWNSDPENYGINAIFFENYWNGGSPATQARYFDNIIISTERIGELFDADFGNHGRTPVKPN